MATRRSLIGLHVLLLSVLACNLQPSPKGPDLAATITAQALTLAAPTGTPAAPTATVQVGVKVSVSSNTNCRTGPSQAFDLVMTANPGQEFEAVGKNSPTGYWIITNPTGGTCWLWGQYAVISGDPSTLPEYPAPPEPTAKATKTPKPTKTPTPSYPTSKPNAPSNLAGPRTCEGFMNGLTPMWREFIHFSWQDNADDEVGFGIYVNGSLDETVLSGTTTYNTQLEYNQGTGGQLFDTFAVEAYNVVGSSSRPAIDVPRCP